MGGATVGVKLSVRYMDWQGRCISRVLIGIPDQAKRPHYCTCLLFRGVRKAGFHCRYRLHLQVEQLVSQAKDSGLGHNMAKLIAFLDLRRVLEHPEHPSKREELLDAERQSIFK